MRTLKWNAFLSGLCACALMVGMAGSARADVTVDKGSSVVVFPYIEWDHDTQTLIQLTNTGNSMLHVSCYYVQTVDYGKPVWEETDFDIWLTKQQPTVWPVGPGRRFNPFDELQGFDVSVPPMGFFIGELKCFEISPTGEPLTGNHLKGEATIIDCDAPEEKMTANGYGEYAWCRGPHDVAKYNAIGIEGNPDLQGSNPLQLDGETYAACPAQLIMNFVADGTEIALGNFQRRGDDLFNSINNEGVVEAKSTTFLTLVPCTEDFENQRPVQTTVQFAVYNEYEQSFSLSTTVDCWFDSQLSFIDTLNDPQRSVFHTNVLGSDVGTAWITPVPGDDAVIGVLTQQLRTAGNMYATVQEPVEWVSGVSYAMTNLHSTGNLAAQITLTGHE